MKKIMTTDEEATPEMEAITNLRSLITSSLEPCFEFSAGHHDYRPYFVSFDQLPGH